MDVERVQDFRFPILFAVAAFLVAAAYGAGLITMAAFDHRVRLAPAIQAPAAADSSGSLINATVDDSAIQLDPVVVPAGTMTFHVRNLGPSFHEFVILRTNHAPGRLPMMMQEGYMRAAEDAKGDINIAELGGIQVGSSKDLTTTLRPGHYVIICNLPKHYMDGMRAGFIVK